MPKASALAQNVGHNHLARSEPVLVSGELRTNAAGEVAVINNFGGHHQTGSPEYLDPETCTFGPRPPERNPLLAARDAMMAHGLPLAPDSLRLEQVRILPGTPAYDDATAQCQREMRLRNPYG